MNGHSITTGLRKLNKHYQSEPVIKPWLVRNDIGEVTIGSHWLEQTVTNKKFKLNYMVFGTLPIVTPVTSIAVPFQIKFRKGTTRFFTVYTQSITENIPFDGGTLPLYEETTDGYSQVYTKVGEVNLTRINESTWKLTSDFNLTFDWVQFTMTYNAQETINNFSSYIGYRKEFENE